MSRQVNIEVPRSKFDSPGVPCRFIASVAWHCTCTPGANIRFLLFRCTVPQSHRTPMFVVPCPFTSVIRWHFSLSAAATLQSSLTFSFSIDVSVYKGRSFVCVSLLIAEISSADVKVSRFNNEIPRHRSRLKNKQTNKQKIFERLYNI